MTKISDYRAQDESGYPVICVAYGNNVAFRCLGCGGPVLAIVREKQRGSSDSNPAICRACGHQFKINVKEEQQMLIVHRLK